ncbi:aminotransferase class I/II-fold pyridoxal phosphate-dependent enzyme [Micromonospora sp. R77]|uniref:DegT/DnrJ/EryC1/StrS family aminotransferase n=1 Tax=Micromonospora sp. R77 TaxID=2925836 RepID=UPI001F610B51|nr:aminotransferase class I/II-fold pyridoxal phosphate-dependent enzyme [Micromonospora sp. R77]MCI4066808.1 aminotransferase class I/II-fold pyridoxal phosphate-dependent enzyme [Micromonospora sp. R77]
MAAPSRTLALFGGSPAIRHDPDDSLFRWPVIGPDDEAAVLDVLRRHNFEGSGNVAALEAEFAEYCGAEYAVAQVNGTAAVLAALYAAGVRPGDEVIAPSSTYWATVLPAFNLGATVVFGDVQPTTMNLDPDDVERRITDRTRAIVVVHMLGYPADMTRFREIGDRHGVTIIEDASHAHGSLYRGRRTGVLGDIAAFSFSGKPIAVGEGGIVVTDNRAMYDRVMAWGQNFRFHEDYVKDPELLRFKGLPLGGVTSRMHPVSAALARQQLRHLDERMAEVDAAMTYFWDRLAGVPGIIAHRPPAGDDRTMGAWYQPHGIYDPTALSGLSAHGFMRAVRAEGYPSFTRNIIREPLHLHPLLNEADVYGTGRPTRIQHSDRDVRQPRGSLPVTEGMRAFGVPPFKHLDEARISRYADLFAKVAENHRALLADDPGDDAVVVDERGNG